MDPYQLTVWLDTAQLTRHGQKTWLFNAYPRKKC